MSDSSEPNTEELVRRAVAGDGDSHEKLLVRHRDRLKRMVDIRMDPRLASRVDPSDIVQDTLVRAANRLAAYLKDRPLPFYPWIRQLALEQIVRQHRRHITAGVRSLKREAPQPLRLPDHSAIELVARLVAGGSTPADHLAQKETRNKVQAVLAELSEADREVLILRYLEGLCLHETAAILGLTANGVKSRQARALERFTRLFGGYAAGGAP